MAERYDQLRMQASIAAQKQLLGAADVGERERDSALTRDKALEWPLLIKNTSKSRTLARNPAGAKPWM